jgi:hypothetical protein
VADRRELLLSSTEPLRLRTRSAGLFLFLPLLARLGFDRLVQRADYPGSLMVPADAALLSLLTLKLLDKERRSHIDDFNFEPALGLFAGLNILPKKSFSTAYSYRTQRHHQEAVLENHYLPRRGHAGPSVQSFFALEHETQVFCYANANLTRAEQPGEVMRFVEFWQALTGHDPQWLYFDSKLTSYAELSRLNERGIFFVTIRRRGPRLLQQLRQRPSSDWTRAVIDIPKRRQKHIRYLEQAVSLMDYQGLLRQIAVTGLGREEPTLFIANHPAASPRDMIMNYARRNRIEDGLGTNVNFFHLDCLASEVRLNVDLDVILTVIANGCYRWLARQLKGFDKAKPKQLYRKFVETSGQIEVLPHRRLLVTFDRRSHNPILREAALDRNCPPIPWLGNYRLEFGYQ